MILGYVSMIVEEERNVLYAYWHFHRSAKSLRAFGWFVGGASCAFCFSGSTGPNFAGGSGDGESHSHLQKKEVWISEKHYREQEKCVWFVRSDVREDRQSMVLFPAKHIHTSLKEACLFWQSDDADSAKQCFFWIWRLSEMYTSELAVSFSCRIYRSIIRDAQTHIVHRRLRC